MLSLITLLPRLRASLAAALALAGAAPAVHAQSQTRANTLSASDAGATFSLKVNVNATAQASASGEPVKFTGAGKITSRLVREPDTGNHVLLATFDFDGITGRGLLSNSRYALTAREAMVLPHAGVQTVSLSFPMEPDASSPLAQVRTGVAHLSFAVNLATGEVMGITASRLELL